MTLVFLCAVPAAQAESATSQGLHITLSPPVHVGDRFEQDGSVRLEETIQVIDKGKKQTPRRLKYSMAKYHAVQTVIDAENNVDLRSRLSFTSLTAASSPSAALLHQSLVGHSVTVTRYPHYEAVRDDQQPISASELTVVRLLLPPNNPAFPSLDQLYHLPRTIHVGDHWQVDLTPAFSQLMSEVQAGKVTVTSVKGSIQAVERKTVENVPCLVLEGSAQGRMSMTTPYSAQPRPATLTLQFQYAVPTDGRTPAIEGHSAITFDISIPSPQPGRTVHVIAERYSGFSHHRVIPQEHPVP